MIYVLIGFGAVALFFALNCFAVFLGRAVAVRLLGLGWVPFFAFQPFVEGERSPYWKRVLAVLMAVAGSYLFVAFFHAGALRIAGKNVVDPDGRGAVVAPIPGTPAEAAGILRGDQIFQVASEPIARWVDLPPALKLHAGQTVDVRVHRGAQDLTVAVAVPTEGRVGVASTSQRRSVAITDALAEGFASPWRTPLRIAKGIGASPPPLSGPVALAAQANASDRALNGLMFFVLMSSSFGVPLALVFAFLTRLRIRPNSAPGRP